MKDIYNNKKIRKNSDIFGEFVACKIENLKTDYAKNTVEHLISNILWEASLGKYDLPPQSAGPGSQYHMTSSYMSEPTPSPTSATSLSVLTHSNSPSYSTTYQLTDQDNWMTENESNNIILKALQNS